MKQKKKRVNPGKVFEKNFIDKIPKNVFFYRLKDDQLGFRGVSNPADMIIFSGVKFYLLELKTVKGKSIPEANITLVQRARLLEESKKKNVISGIIVNFRETPDNETYFLSADKIDDGLHGRKSIPLVYFRNHGIKINSTLKRVHHWYDIEEFITNTGG